MGTGFRMLSLRQRVSLFCIYGVSPINRPLEIMPGLEKNTAEAETKTETVGDDELSPRDIEA